MARKLEEKLMVAQGHLIMFALQHQLGALSSMISVVLFLA